MNTNKVKIVLFLFVLLFACSFNNLCFGKTGDTGASFLKIGIGARPIGMGSAYTAIANDVNAIYWNPAGLSQLSKREISAMHNEWISDIKYDFIGYAHPIKTGALGMSFVYLSMGDMERRGENREKLSGEFGAYDFAGTISFSQAVGKNTGLGMNLKVIQQKIEDERATGVAVDLGLMIKAKQALPLQFGVAIQNLGPKMKFISESYSLPLMAAIGAGYDIGGVVTMALDIKHQIFEEKTVLSLGTEYWPMNVIALRAGYLIKLLDKAYKDSLNEEGLGDFNGLGAGLGVRISGYQMDYSLVPYGDLGQTHRVSFSLKF